VNKVFGIGWAKTGTTTLGNSFKILGYDHQSQNLRLVKEIKQNDFSEILKIAKKKESFEDWPWILLYKELDILFPGSKFILTKRDTQKWIKSYKNMLVNQGEASQEINKIRQTLYGLPFPCVSDAELIDRYEKHNFEVESYFKSRPNDLLVVNWEDGHGWRELCNFLGKEVPTESFPHSNKGEYKRHIKNKKRSFRRYLWWLFRGLSQ